MLASTHSHNLTHMQLEHTASIADILEVLCSVAEFDDLPVRHSEDELNETLASRVR